MSQPMSRRAFLAGIGALVGLGVAGLAWAASRGGTAAVPTTTTGAFPMAEAPTSTQPAATTTTTATPGTTTSPTSVLPAIAVIPRAAWGAVPSGPDMVQQTIERLTVHHTARTLVDNREAPAVLRDWQEFHRGEGWPDLAYHFTIDRNGHVYAGRDVRFRGDTRTSYDPTGHFLVALEGNFEEQDPSSAQVAALVMMLAWAAATFAVGADTIAGHRAYAATACPGAALQALIDDGSLLAAVLAAEPHQLAILPFDEGTALIAAIEAGTD